jgi:hypothetical protein
MGPGLVHAAHVVLIKELAGLVAFLDSLFALLGDFDDMPLLEVRDAHIQVLGQPPYVIAADPHIPCHPAAQRRAFQAV